MSEHDQTYNASSSDLIKPVRRKIRIYGCGGTGTDVLRQYRENSKLENQGIFAEEHDSFIDTSISNLHGVSASSVYKLPNIEGGGKDRRKVLEAATPLMPEIMLKHPGEEINVMIGSGSGGSGPVLLTLIAEWLLKEGKSVFIIMLIDYTSQKATDNSLKTLMGLEMLSQNLGKAIPIHITEVDPNKSLIANDIAAKYALGAMSILASGLNTRLDAADVEHFINYPAVTHHQPGLAQLIVTPNLDDVKKLQCVASFAALLKSEEAARPSVPCGYDAIGWLPEGEKGYQDDFYFATQPGLGDLVDRLNKLYKDLEAQKKVQVQTGTLLGHGHRPSGDSSIII